MIGPPPRGNVDWNKARETLREIQKINPGFTSDNSVIGGSAAWFYRTLLEKDNDQDFRLPHYTAAENAIWLSKDLDFIGTKRADYPAELQTKPEGEPPKIRIKGVWVDSPDEGLFITKDRALKTAIEVENPAAGSFYKIASPTLLYREKKTLILKKIDRPQDSLHLKTLEQASKLVICKLAEDQALNQKQAGLLFKLLKEAQEIAPEILQDPCLLKRLARQMKRLATGPHTKAIFHLLKNQIIQEENLLRSTKKDPSPKIR